jgi:hypothetical protein
MRTYYSILIVLSFLIIAAFQDRVKTVDVIDLRKSGIQKHVDTLIAGHQWSDVIVNRIIAKGEGPNEKNGMLELYDIHFYANYEGKLHNYLISYNDTDNFTRADYRWQNDSTVGVKLINVSSKRNVTLVMTHLGKTAYLLNDYQVKHTK